MNVFFFNAKWKFKIPAPVTDIPGSVIAASAISPVDLERRKFGQYPHLKYKLLDPQLYVATLDQAVDPDTVAKLAAYPWFHGADVPAYKSGQHGTRTAWKKQHKGSLVSKWTRTLPTDAKAIKAAAVAAVQFQQKLGCDGIILPAPLTTMADQTLQQELEWIEAGIQACGELNVQSPVYATAAFSEAVLHIPALNNTILHSLSNHIASRQELSGAYVVLEQSDPGPYFWNSKDPLMSLLIFVDDLVRGAGKTVVTNYVGTFGIVASAAGAHIWSSGYYLAQRRFSLKGAMGIARPRYHSFPLAGDIGLKDDIARINAAGLITDFLAPTKADAVLRSALAKGKTPDLVPEWRHSANNCAAAQEHYLDVVAEVGSKLQGMGHKDKIQWVYDWLEKAVYLANLLEQKGLVGISTDTTHQQVWLDVYTAWRNYTKQ